MNPSEEIANHPQGSARLQREDPMPPELVIEYTPPPPFEDDDEDLITFFVWPGTA